MTKIRIRKAPGTWTVRAGGAVLAESREALALAEDDHREVIYFPRTDIAMAFLDPTAHRTECPHKGTASYFSIATRSQTLKNAAWSYDDPKEEVGRIRGHIAFCNRDDVTVERV